MDNQKINTLIRSILRGLSISLFVFSLTQKGFCTSNNCGESFLILIFGGVGMITGGATFTWLANPAIWISWFAIKNLKVSLISSCIALALASSFLLFHEIADNEGGVRVKIISYELGYWIWLTSISLMALGNICLFINHRIQEKANR